VVIGGSRLKGSARILDTVGGIGKAAVSISR
jgi:hypothetical protein